jgi:sulfofructose kinase
MASELISIGLSVLDYLFLCDQPVRGTLGPSTDHLVQGGGLAATAAVAMARRGGGVEMWTRVGDDFAGRFILDQFVQEGVDISQVRVCRGGRSPACAVRVDLRRAERYFTYFGGRGLDPSAEGLEWSRIDAAKAILVDCTWLEAQVPAARRARERGVPVCADVGGVSDRVAELLRCVDYPIYNEDCARRYGGTGSTEGDLRKLAPLGGKAPMVTLGAQGCIWLEDGQVHRLPAFQVEAVDTTGCGDVFHGAFTFGLARGWDVAANARFASATAALKCRALGGRTGIPACGEVVEFLRRHP